MVQRIISQRLINMWLLYALIVMASFVIAPIAMIPGAFVAEYTTKESKIPCLPPELSWLNTPDDVTGDQGMYEDQVKWWYDTFGWRIKTWYWLGWRNQMYGLMDKLVAHYDGSEVTESTWWKVKIYSCQGHKEITWPGRRVSFGYKVHTLKTAEVGDPIMWVFMPAFWKTREY